MVIDAQNGLGAGRTARFQTLPEQIAENVCAKIVSGELAPGDRIREDHLADEFGVSRAPVREALRILERDSVVLITPNKGARVTQLSVKEVSDIFELRRELMGLMLSGLDITGNGVLERMERAVSEMERIVEANEDAPQFSEISYRISRAILVACTNDKLTEILQSLSRQTRRYTELGLASQARRQESARLWREMLEALKTNRRQDAIASAARLIDASCREAVCRLEEEQLVAQAATR